MSKKTITVRMDEEVLQKLRVVADYEGRTASGQVNILIRKCVEQFERKQQKAQRRERAKNLPLGEGGPCNDG